MPSTMRSLAILLVVAALTVLTSQKHFDSSVQRGRGGASLELIRHNDRHLRSLYRRNTQNLKRQNVPQAVLENIGQDGLYSAIIFIGTPPQPLEFDITTGDADVFIVTNLCGQAACNNSGQVPFVPQDSSTFSSQPEPVVLTLEGGTLNGTIATDVLDFAGLSTTSQRFVAVNSITAGPETSLDSPGVLGMAFDGVSQTQESTIRTTPLWRTLNETGQLGQPLMGLYVTRFNNVTGAAFIEPGGQLTMGYLNTSLFTGNVEYHDVVQQGPELTLFDIPISSFTVNGTAVPVNGSGANSNLATINLGQAFLQGPVNIISDIYLGIGGRNATGALANMNLFELPCNSTVEASLSFGGTAWTITSADIVSAPSAPGDEFCLGLFGGTSTDLETNTTWIIGEPFFKNVYTSFRWDPPAVGFAQLAPPVLAGSVSFGLPETTSASTVVSSSTQSLSTPAPTNSQTSAATVQYDFRSYVVAIGLISVIAMAFF